MYSACAEFDTFIKKSINGTCKYDFIQMEYTERKRYDEDF